MTVPSEAVAAYVQQLDRARRERPAEDLEAAALAELQDVGAMVLPVEDGEWTLRADRDEQGPFVAASFEAAS